MALPENILAPIPGDNPGGANLRYDPIAEKIKEARREEDELPTGEWVAERKVADHKTVIKLATDVITTKSKDLQMAAWLTESLLKTQGFPGFNDGIGLVNGIVTIFWDSCYPQVPPEELPPPDGEEDEGERAQREDEYREEREGALELRAAPIAWITTALEIPLRQAPITKSGLGFVQYKESRAVGSEADTSGNDEKSQRRAALIAEGKLSAEDWDAAEAATGNELLRAERAALRSSLETIQALNSFCQEKFGELAPHLSPLRQTLEELQHFVNGLLKQRGDVEETEGGTAPGGEEGGEGKPEASLVISGATPASPSEVGPRLEAIARFLRGHDAQNPAPYTMLRGFRWGELRAGGGRPDPRKLEAPPGEVRQRIKKFALENNSQAVIDSGEKLMSEPGGRAWLDLQRYVVQACGKLGYRAPASAIRAELRALLLDIPDLPNWTLMDDSPTATAETKVWLKQVVSGTAPIEEGDPMEAPIEQEGTPLDETPISLISAAPDAYHQALEAGNAIEAMRILNRDLARQPSGRARFQRRLQMARICFDHSQFNLAHLFLEQLVASVDEHKLESWETGEMVASALAMLYKTKLQRGEDPSGLEPLYNRIATLDPVQALNNTPA
ncbi:MAG TPA: type VI secretion system domain-containing protein [Bryobacteraceae bacterium]|jgi:type VI secretion system protein ImpA